MNLLSAKNSFSSPQNLYNKLKRYQQIIRNKKTALQSLSKKEKNIVKQLTKLDNEIFLISQKLKTQEQKLTKIKEKEAILIKNYHSNVYQKEQLKKNLEQILAKLWPIYLKNKQTTILDTKNETEYKLKIKLYSIILEKIKNIQQKLKIKCQEISIQLLKLKNLKKTYLSQLNKINKTKDELLAKKLLFLKKIQETRLAKLKEEENIQQILETIEQLNYQISILKNKKFSKAKGLLPWPAKGQIKIRFNLRHKPPIRGIGMVLSPNTPIKAIFWGKVVHNDILRGFGDVIILSHGQGYYSLYAFLAKSFVKLGQNVEKGEVIGKCGYYPKLKSYGLYFELRFRQKPVNPFVWLKK
ncbi:MAG: peptidoglycan DD-metalloendopeptidase family protein [Desulfonauticus sp.]|nr:peptidoglycan DD-metalloendopeptidase family protein [Desulfonauticus sp.]